MTAEIIAFPVNPGNGARDALIEIMKATSLENPEGKTDVLLTLLWFHGFKVVPLDGNDIAKVTHE